jgi:hypothetical protein
MVQPLNEGLREVGLDPDKALAEIHRRDKLVSARMRGGAGGGAPGYVRQPQRQPQQTTTTPVTEGREPGEGEETAVALDEAIRTVRKRRLTSSEKSKGRRQRRKTRSTRKAYSKKYRSRMRRKIARRSKMKRKKFGGTAGLAKLHKMGRRIVMSADSALANLREDLNSQAAGGQGSTNAYDDAAFNAGLLAMYLGEMFEAYGDTQSAQTMFDASDVGADLSEEFEKLGADADAELDEVQEEKLQALLQSVVKGLRIYEAMGNPSFAEIVDHVTEANGDDDEDEGDEEDDDEDDDDDDGEGDED